MSCVEATRMSSRCFVQAPMTTCILHLSFMVYSHMGVSINGGTPKWMVYILMDNRTIPLKWMIWRYPYFRIPPHVHDTRCCQDAPAGHGRASPTMSAGSDPGLAVFVCSPRSARTAGAKNDQLSAKSRPLSHPQNRCGE